MRRYAVLRNSRWRVSPMSRIPKNAGRHWDSIQDDELIRNLARGLNPKQIALVMGRTVPGIEARIERLQPEQSEEDVAALIEDIDRETYGDDYEHLKYSG